jgi:hypothetical protein
VQRGSGWLLLRRARASAELDELAVQQRQQELKTRRASDAIGLAREIEKLKDPAMRKALTAEYLRGLSSVREVSGTGTESLPPSAAATPPMIPAGHPTDTIDPKSSALAAS